MKKEIDTTYQSKDLSLSAALHAAGRRFLGLAPSEDVRAFYFTFAEADKCEETATAYYAGTLRVSALEYANALRTLRGVVFSRR